MSDIQFYKRKSEVIQASQVSKETAQKVAKYFNISEDEIQKIEVGDYVVRQTNGEFQIYTKEEFDNLFEPI